MRTLGVWIKCAVCDMRTLGGWIKCAVCDMMSLDQLDIVCCV